MQKFIVHRYFSNGQLGKTSIAYRMHNGSILDNNAISSDVLIFNYNMDGSFIGSETADRLNKLEKAILNKGGRKIGALSEFKDKHGYSFDDGLKNSTEKTDLIYAGAIARDEGHRVNGYSDEELVNLLIPKIGDDDIVENGTVGFNTEENRAKNNGNIVKLLNTVIKPLVPEKTVEIIKDLGLDKDKKPFQRGVKVRLYKIDKNETF